MITKRFFIIFGLTVLLLAAGCTAEPQTIEVTRVVNMEVPVTVEVTRLVAEAPQEVIKEVTRIVEIPVTEPAPEPTAEPATSPTPEPTATTALAAGTYIVQAGDSLYTIAENAGITIAALRAANGMDENSPLIAGRELVIPAPGEEVVVPPTVAAPSTGPEAPVVEAAPPADAPPAPAPTGANLLPNPSFEEGWHFYLYNELQVPDGWQLAINEGANNIEGGSGGVFNRPEVRVISTADLPPAEHSTFVLNGNKTVKAFKGAAPTTFSMFTDIALQPGTYRFTMRFVPDTVIGFDDGKVYSPDPLDAEVRIIAGNGGTVWQGTSAGQPNTLTHEFTLDQAQTIRLGGDFRNRSIMANNGWFLDDWSLVRLE